MKQHEIEYIKSLDKHGMSGTVQGILLGNLGDLNTIRFESVLKYLIETFQNERDVYQKENTLLRSILVENGLYTSKNLGLE